MEEWKTLEKELAPLARRSTSLTEDEASAHQRLLELRGSHPMKDLVRDQMDETMLFDVKAIEEAIKSGSLTIRPGTFKTSYARKVWGVICNGGIVEQDDQSRLDLIWVLRMPDERAQQPVLVIEYEQGCDLLDGAHRLTRALVDDKLEHPSYVFNRSDVLKYRVEGSSL